MAASVSVNNNHNSNNNNSSRLAKIVCLSDWWLIWADNEIHEKKLGIAGFTSINQKALRIFSSAPILKRYDVFTLETTDGIYVMINGLMNKARTLENGFPSEVSNHFLFGFPPHWEACAEKFLGQAFASNGVSRENVKGSSTANEKTYTREKVSPATVDQKLNEDHTQEGSRKSSKAVRYIISDSTTTKAAYKKAASDEKETKENVRPAGADTKPDEDHTVCMTQKSSKKSNKVVQCVTSSGGAKNTTGKETATVEEETGEYVSSASADLKLNQDHTVGVCVMQEGSEKSNIAVAIAGGAKNTGGRKIAAVEKENIKYVTPVTGDCAAKKTDHKKTASVVEEAIEKVCPTGANPKVNQDDTGTVCIIQECSMKSNTTVGYLPSSGRGKKMGDKKMPSVEKETIEYVSPASADSKFDIDHTVCMPKKSSMKCNKAVRCVTSASSAKNTDCNKTAAVIEETGDIVSHGSADPKLDQDHTVCMTQEASNKSNRAARYITRASGARNTDRKETEAFGKESTITEKPTTNQAGTSHKRTKRKLTYESPMTPKGDEITSVVSPDSLSTKKSRSGRLLLPTLEYWRNQTAVYDADHQVTGIKHGISTPSRVEVTHEPKKARRRPRKSEDSLMMKEGLLGSLN